MVQNNNVFITLSELQLAGAKFLASDLPGYIASLKLNDFKTVVADLKSDLTTELKEIPPHNGGLLKDALNATNAVGSFIGQHPSETLGTLFSHLLS
jgi:hypothetical protein